MLIENKGVVEWRPTGRYWRCAGLSIPSAWHCQPVRICELELIVMLGVIGLPTAADD